MFIHMKQFSKDYPLDRNIFRANRRKKDFNASTVKYTITVQREDSEELVITDNLVYNLDETESNIDVNIDNEDAQEITENDTLLNNVEDIQDVDNSNADLEEVEYTNSQSIDMSPADTFILNRKTIIEVETSGQGFLTDDEKMDLYANKYISRNKSSIVENDQVYSNEYSEQCLES